MSAPLSGLRIVEFGNLVAAPYCGMLLADLGAEVIKIEPLGGDLAREIGPFYGEESAFFIAVNRGKKSVAIDAKAPLASTVLRRLCLGADVVLNNLRRGAMERMGLGYRDLSDGGGHVVYASITAFGATGPDADRPGIDLVFQGESGMMSIAGDEGDPPHKTATTIADFVAGTNAALAIVAAIAGGGGRRGGEGRLVEVALRDSLIAVQAGWNAQFFASGNQPERTGTASPVTAPNQSFRTADGYFNVAVVSDRHFAETAKALDLFELGEDPRFGSNALRVENRQALTERLQTVFETRPTDHWIDVLSRAGIPVGRILDLPAVFADRQAQHNEMLVAVEHPRAGSINTQGSPLRVDGSPARSQLPAPFLGQHTREVLTDLGITDDEIDDLVRAGEAVE
ncbi:MAG: CoA transferase [Acidimicrobiia bacterium]|nr:CoA transferase [Acidimicrobiia bacterium]MDQ3501073.1 CoA transferase [Actinomycetota bacterium]